MRVARSEALAGVSGRTCVRPGWVRSLLLGVCLAAGLCSASVRAAERRDPLDTAALLATSYRVDPDLVYLSTPAWEGKVDLYLPRRPNTALPTAVLFHGGGWVTGSKDEIALDPLPYLEMGFAVVNVDYRLARVAPAPAAVEDARCALRWVIRHAPQYGFDLHKLVLVGSSAGGHLALVAGLAPVSAGFDRLCPGDEPLHVAAIVNFFGISDVEALVQPPSPRDFAVGWLGGGVEKAALARQVSPIAYVKAGGPAVFTVHGDSDPVVPFAQATKLHAALGDAGIPNQLYVVKGGHHGDFHGDDVLRISHAVRDFLLKRGVISGGKRWYEMPPAPLVVKK